MIEIIKEVKDFEGYYLISNLGYVISLPRNDADNKHGARKIKRKLKPNTVKGYPRVTLACKGRQKRIVVHRLVAEHFLEPIKGKPFINHIDGNKLNSRQDNLEWCTSAENAQHAFNTGLSTNAQQTATKAATQKAAEYMVTKLNTDLGINLISTEVINKRRWVTYSCPSCNNIYTHRSDNPSVLRGGICRGCFIKVKI